MKEWKFERNRHSIFDHPLLTPHSTFTPMTTKHLVLLPGVKAALLSAPEHKGAIHTGYLESADLSIFFLTSFFAPFRSPLSIALMIGVCAVSVANGIQVSIFADVPNALQCCPGACNLSAVVKPEDVIWDQDMVFWICCT